jgi:hypothetical protein
MQDDPPDASSSRIVSLLRVEFLVRRIVWMSDC